MENILEIIYDNNLKISLEKLLEMKDYSKISLKFREKTYKFINEMKTLLHFYCDIKNDSIFILSDLDNFIDIQISNRFLIRYHKKRKLIFIELKEDENNIINTNYLIQIKDDNVYKWVRLFTYNNMFIRFFNFHNNLSFDFNSGLINKIEKKDIPKYFSFEIDFEPLKDIKILKKIKLERNVFDLSTVLSFLELLKPEIYKLLKSEDKKELYLYGIN